MPSIGKHYGSEEEPPQLKSQSPSKIHIVLTFLRHSELSVLGKIT